MIGPLALMLLLDFPGIRAAQETIEFALAQLLRDCIDLTLELAIEHGSLHVPEDTDRGVLQREGITESRKTEGRRRVVHGRVVYDDLRGAHAPSLKMSQFCMISTIAVPSCAAAARSVSIRCLRSLSMVRATKVHSTPSASETGLNGWSREP